MLHETHRSETAFAHAFAAAGMDTCREQMKSAIALWMNRGRSEGELHKLVSDIYEQSRAANGRMSNDHTWNAASRLPNGDDRTNAGHEPGYHVSSSSHERAQQDLGREPVSALARSPHEEGHPTSGQEPRSVVSSSPSPLYVKVAAAAAKQMAARTLLDTFLVEGMPIGNFTIGEVAKIGKRKGVEHFVCASIHARYGQARQDQLVRSLVGPELLATIVRQAEESADVFGS